MSSRKLDWQNPGGMATFALFKEITEIEKNILESFRGIETSSIRPKTKGVYYTVEVEVDSSEEEPSTHTSNADITKVWFNSFLNYPCPLESHTHEMAECKEWLGMRLRIRWESTKQRMICYMCLKPKYVCKNRQCRI